MTFRILLMLAFCQLTACAAGPRPTLVQAAIDIQPIKVPPSANSTRPPPSLPQPQTGAMPDLEANHRQVAEAFHQLAAQLCSLLKYLEIEHRECLPYLQEPGGPDAPASGDRR